MDTLEYRQFIAILQDAHGSIKEVADDPSVHRNMASSLKEIVVKLENAIEAYQDKVKAARS